MKFSAWRPSESSSKEGLEMAEHPLGGLPPYKIHLSYHPAKTKRASPKACPFFI
jgi:hypothetical protein